MDCARFDELLFESLDSGLRAGDEERMRWHAQTCIRCRELAALVGGGIDNARTDVPFDLVAGVLSRTSGGACERAASLLATDNGSALVGDGSLLDAHLEACSECTVLARALVQLRHELPALATLDPGETFVAQVMAATVGSTKAAHLPLLRRIEEIWERMAQRPRLAFEGAYAGLLVIFLVFGLPSQSVAQLPARAIDGIRVESIKVERVVSSGFGEIVAHSRATWNDSAARAQRFLATTERDPGAASRLERGLRDWGGAVREIAAGVWNRLFIPFREHLRALWRDAPSNVVDRAPNQ